MKTPIYAAPAVKGLKNGVHVSFTYHVTLKYETTQQTQNICITFTR